MRDMISFEFKICLFVASFSPMWFILLGSYLLYDFTPNSIITCFVITILIIVSIVISCNMIEKYRNSNNMDMVKPKYVRDITHKYTAQLVAYVFFIFVDFTMSHNIFVIIGLAVFFCIVFSRTNLVLTNPAFFVVGFRIYESEVEQPNRKIILLSRNDVKKDEDIEIKEIAPGIYVDRLIY